LRARENRWPASVNPTLRVVRMKSAAPTRASSARTAWRSGLMAVKNSDDKERMS
jgi:hypothetical protein